MLNSCDTFAANVHTNSNRIRIRRKYELGLSGANRELGLSGANRELGLSGANREVQMFSMHRLL